MRAERDNVSFFRIPVALNNRGEYLDALSRERPNAWVKALKRGHLSESQLRNGRVCSRHFIAGKPAALEDKTNPAWIPSQHLGYISSILASTSASSRFERSLKRARVETQVQSDLPDENQEKDNAACLKELQKEDIAETVTHSENCVSQGTQTDLTEEHLSRVFSELDFCNSKIYTLQSKLDIMDLNEDSFKNDNKTLYFSGFSKASMLFIIYENVVPYLSSHPNRALTTFQQLLLTLIKLRLNLPFRYLSYRFAVSPTTASETFYQTINILYNKFKHLVYWPESKDLEKNVPACFMESFGNKVAVIIDCFEVFTETVKFLIGITPHETISYISKSWGGRTSDKFLTENCGFLNLILRGDIVLADRGFLIEDSLKTLGAKLEIPVFTRGKTQLHPTDLENTRNIATVRIHVERIIGMLKKNITYFKKLYQ